MTDYGNQYLPDGRQFKWNAHSLDMLQTCPRKYYYRNLLGYRQAGGSVHLIFGTHYANALERYFIYQAEGDPNPLHRVIREALADTWEWDVEHQNEKKNRWTLIRSIVWYFEHFAEADLEIAMFDGTPAVEHQFCLELDDENFLVGTLDRLVTKNGDYFVMDQKTTGNTIGPYFFNQFSPNMQMSAYTWAGQAVYSTPVRGVIIDACQLAVGFSDFSRAATMRTAAQLEEWHQDVLRWIDYANECHRLSHWPMNTSSCSMYGGCEFRRACAMSPEFRMNYIDGNFEREPRE